MYEFRDLSIGLKKVPAFEPGKRYFRVAKWDNSLPILTEIGIASSDTKQAGDEFYIELSDGSTVFIDPYSDYITEVKDNHLDTFSRGPMRNHEFRDLLRKIKGVSAIEARIAAESLAEKPKAEYLFMEAKDLIEEVKKILGIKRSEK